MFILDCVTEALAELRNRIVIAALLGCSFGLLLAPVVASAAPLPGYSWELYSELPDVQLSGVFPNVLIAACVDGGQCTAPEPLGDVLDFSGWFNGAGASLGVETYIPDDGVYGIASGAMTHFWLCVSDCATLPGYTLADYQAVSGLSTGGGDPPPDPPADADLLAAASAAASAAADAAWAAEQARGWLVALVGVGFAALAFAGYATGSKDA